MGGEAWSEAWSEARAAAAPANMLGGVAAHLTPARAPSASGARSPFPCPAPSPAQVTLGHSSTTVPARLSLLLPPHSDGNGNDPLLLQDLDLCPPHLLGLDAALGGGAVGQEEPVPLPVTLLLSLHCMARATPPCKTRTPNEREAFVFGTEKSKRRRALWLRQCPRLLAGEPEPWRGGGSSVSVAKTGSGAALGAALSRWAPARPTLD